MCFEMCWCWCLRSAFLFSFVLASTRFLLKRSAKKSMLFLKPCWSFDINFHSDAVFPLHILVLMWEGTHVRKARKCWVSEPPAFIIGEGISKQNSVSSTSTRSVNRTIRVSFLFSEPLMHWIVHYVHCCPFFWPIKMVHSHFYRLFFTILIFRVVNKKLLDSLSHYTHFWI